MSREPSLSLPPYEVDDNASIVPLPLPALFTDGGNPLIGGSGVRFPLYEEERTRFDRKVLKRLDGFPAEVRWYEGEGPDREAFYFRVKEVYKGATSQLDALLPLLPSNQVGMTSLRTVTLRLPQLPAPDIDWLNSKSHIGRRDGRRVLDEAYKAWTRYFPKAAESLWIVADSIFRRIATEGFIIVEEHWLLEDSIVQFTVRC